MERISKQSVRIFRGRQGGIKMKKDEFFQILKKKLAIIEENELNDILNEYEQHIAMKMQNGEINEEEAIKDFGNIDELVAEILESYHVKVNYNAQMKEEKQAQFKESAKEIGENTKHFCGKVFQKTKELLKKSWNSTKACFKNIVDKVKRLVKNESKEKELLIGTDKLLPQMSSSQKETHGKPASWMKKIVGWCRGIFKSFIRLCVWGIRLVWNLCVIGLAVFVGIFTCIMLYICGASIVFLVMDYPLWGVLLVSLGVVIFSAAIVTGFGLLIRRKKGKKSFLTEKARTVVKIIVVTSIGVSVLLTGIGTGIGIMEFSSFTYGGEKPLFKEEKSTIRVSAEVPLEGTQKIELEHVYNGNAFVNAEVVFDDSIPLGQICYEIEQKQKETKYAVNVESCYGYDYDTPEDEQQYKGEVYQVYLSQYYGGSELKMMMELKDKIMKDIKERKLYSYRTNEINSIKVLANPQMKKYFDGLK